MSQVVLSLASEDIHLGDSDLEGLKDSLDERLSCEEVLGMSTEPDLSVSLVVESREPSEIVDAVHEAFDDHELFEGVVAMTLQEYDPDDDPDLESPPFFEKHLDLEAGRRD